MTTLNGLPEPAPQTGPKVPPLPDLPASKPLAPGAAARPTVPAEILPIIAEPPAWPRVFPGL